MESMTKAVERPPMSPASLTPRKPVSGGRTESVRARDGAPGGACRGGGDRQQRRPPYTNDNLRADCRQHAQDQQQALDRYGPLPRRSLRLVRSLLRRGRALELRYINPYAREAWQKYLLDALLRRGIDAVPDLRTITIINGDWQFSEKSQDFDLERLKRQIRKILRGYNYIVMIEFAYIRNYQDGHGTGRVIVPHVQGLIWGVTPGLRTQRAKLTPSMAGADPIHLRVVNDAAGGLAGAVSYMVKPPYHGYRLWKKSTQGFGHRREPLPLKVHHYLLTHLFQYEYDQLALSGGKGMAVLRTARAAADRPFRDRDRRR